MIFEVLRTFYQSVIAQDTPDLSHHSALLPLSKHGDIALG